MVDVNSERFGRLSSQKTPKALANLSPGLERSDNPGVTKNQKPKTLKGFAARGTLLGSIDYLFERTQGSHYVRTQGWN
jgi:hypothetical protein